MDPLESQPLDVSRAIAMLDSVHKHRPSASNAWDKVHAHIQAQSEEIQRLRKQIKSEELASKRDLEDLLISARAIAERRGKDTAWERFSQRLAQFGIGKVTPRGFKLCDDELETVSLASADILHKDYGYNAIPSVVLSMLDNEGVYVCGDKEYPNATVVLVSLNGDVYSTRLDDKLDPTGFKPSLTVNGPLRKKPKTD